MSDAAVELESALQHRLYGAFNISRAEAGRMAHALMPLIVAHTADLTARLASAEGQVEYWKGNAERRYEDALAFKAAVEQARQALILAKSMILSREKMSPEAAAMIQAALLTSAAGGQK